MTMMSEAWPATLSWRSHSCSRAATARGPQEEATPATALTPDELGCELSTRVSCRRLWDAWKLTLGSLLLRILTM